MIGTICVRGSSGLVMAPLGSMGTFVETRRTLVEVTGLVDEEEIPVEIRQLLIGRKLSAIFMGGTLNKHLRRCSQVDPRRAFVYMGEVIEALQQTEHNKEADILRGLFGELDLLGFSPETINFLF